MSSSYQQQDQNGLRLTTSQSTQVLSTQYTTGGQWASIPQRPGNWTLDPQAQQQNVPQHYSQTPQQQSQWSSMSTQGMQQPPQSAQHPAQHDIQTTQYRGSLQQQQQQAGTAMQAQQHQASTAMQAQQRQLKQQRQQLQRQQKVLDQGKQSLVQQRSLQQDNLLQQQRQQHEATLQKANADKNSKRQKKQEAEDHAFTHLLAVSQTMQQGQYTDTAREVLNVGLTRQSGELRREAFAKGAEAIAKFDWKVQNYIFQLGRCPVGYGWVPMADGYMCRGTHHFIPDDEIDLMIRGRGSYYPRILKCGGFGDESWYWRSRSDRF